MFLDALERQLVALQAQLESMQALIDDVRAGQEWQAAQATPPACPHTETEDEGTFGASVTRCVACKAIVKE